MTAQIGPAYPRRCIGSHFGDTTRSRVVSVATTPPGTNLKAAAGMLHTIALFNTTASAIFVKFYDQAAAPAVGTDAVAFTIQVPPNNVAPAGILIQSELGIPFASGIGFGITGAQADADATAVGAGAITGFFVWS